MATQMMRGDVTNAGFGAGRGDQTPSFFDRISALWNDYARYQRTRHELESLSDRELADIGLSRGDIDGVARGQTSLPR